MNKRKEGVSEKNLLWVAIEHVPIEFAVAYDDAGREANAAHLHVAIDRDPVARVCEVCREPTSPITTRHDDEVAASVG